MRSRPELKLGIPRHHRAAAAARIAHRRALTTVLRRPLGLGLSLSVIPFAIGAAQLTPRDGGDPCFRARPAPACRVFFLTNAGAYVRLLGTKVNSVVPYDTRQQSPARAIVDWGVIVNLDPRNGVGGSWFVALDEDDFSTGPVLRYRRWFTPMQSLDVAVGTPVAGGNGITTGSVLALIKYNPVHWFGVAVRPEYVRRQAYDCRTIPCTPFLEQAGRLYVGAEFGWYPGLALSAGSGLTLAALLVAVAAGGGFD